MNLIAFTADATTVYIVYTLMENGVLPSDFMLLWMASFTHCDYNPKGHTTQILRHYDIKTTSRRRFDVVMTLYLRRVPTGM